MIGIFGGTFDPIHFGHLRTVTDVAEALQLEQVRLIPLRSPPHRAPPIASGSQRAAMIEAAIEDNPGLVLDQRELNRDGYSYTLDTLRSLQKEFPEETVCLITGSDAFNHFPSWHQPEAILDIAHLVVMHRPGEPIAPHYPDRQTEDPELLRNLPTGMILSQTVTQLDISSTKIRQTLRQGKSARYLLPKAVLDLIKTTGLYQ